ncbi:MAG: PqqD family protein [Acidobacteriota bacterium]|nr:PqqD family protein [Acidobacteriota bacterium]
MNTAEKVNGSSVWIPSKNTVGCEVEGEMVLLDLQSGTYFGLNAVGAEIWNQLTRHKSFDEILRYLLSRYRVSEERCEAELRALLSNLSERGLVRSGNDETAA